MQEDTRLLGARRHEGYVVDADGVYLGEVTLAEIVASEEGGLPGETTAARLAKRDGLFFTPKTSVWDAMERIGRLRRREHPGGGGWCPPPAGCGVRGGHRQGLPGRDEEHSQRGARGGLNGSPKRRRDAMFKPAADGDLSRGNRSPSQFMAPAAAASA